MKSLIALITTLIATAAFVPDVSACGGSLYRVGKGISYRVYTAPLPGNVLVYGSSQAVGELAMALSESGHNVDVVRSELELSLQMGNGGYDVVIGAYSDHDAIESMVNTSASQMTYLPVVGSDSEKEMLKQTYDRVMVANRDEIKHYLKAIHKTLKSRA